MKMQILRHSGIILPFAIGLLLSSCTTSTEQPIPCLVKEQDVRPLTIGQPLQMQVGSLVQSDCQVNNDAATSWTWKTSDPTIVEVSPVGNVTGLKSGSFTLNASNGNKLLTTQGFVLPADWTIKIEPANATVKVGDIVPIQVITYDAKNQVLPTVPFSLYTPEFSQPDNAKAAIVEPMSYQQVTTPGVFRATKPGSTTITGKLGDKQVQAKLTITD